MQLNINLGGKFYICATPQTADLDLAAFQALTWVEVGGVGSVGEMGRTQNVPAYDTWNRNTPHKAKGMTDGGNPPVEVARDTADAGQDILRTAASPTERRAYAVKVEHNDKLTVPGGSNSCFYNRALVTGPTRPQGRAEDFDLEVFTLGMLQDELSSDPT